MSISRKESKAWSALMKAFPKGDNKLTHEIDNFATGEPIQNYYVAYTASNNTPGTLSNRFVEPIDAVNDLIIKKGRHDETLPNP